MSSGRGRKEDVTAGRKKRLIGLAAVAAVVSTVLAWPVGTWLEQRERRPEPDFQPDAVYVVAGATDRPRRIEATIAFLTNRPPADLSKVALWVGNDRLKSRWSTAAQRNLFEGEWALENLKDRVRASTGNAAAADAARIIPGEFKGTDGEMQALADYLEGHPEIRRLAMVTSPFHVRRAAGRLTYHLRRPVEVRVEAAEGQWTDRAPWTVLAEVVKMGRDRLGWSRAPLLSRR